MHGYPPENIKVGYQGVFWHKPTKKPIKNLIQTFNEFNIKNPRSLYKNVKKQLSATGKESTVAACFSWLSKIYNIPIEEALGYQMR